MGIDNVSKLEANNDGTYTATCKNRCETETVVKKDLELGYVCRNKYLDRDESFLKVKEQISFTAYEDYTRCSKREISIKNRFVLHRVSKYHHTLENLKSKYFYDCILQKSHNFFVFHYFDRSELNHIEFNIRDKGYIQRIKTNNYMCVEGDFADCDMLKLELDKRELIRKSGVTLY